MSHAESLHHSRSTRAIELLAICKQSVVEGTAQAETAERPVKLAMIGVTAASASPDSNDITSAHSYDYRYKGSSLTNWQDPVEIGTATATVSGLTSVVQYDFQIRATNVGVESDWPAAI